MALIAKKSSKNQVTLPKRIVDLFPDVEYFEVSEENGRIVLAPLKPGRSDEVRRRLSSLGISESDITDAIDWARSRR